LAAVLPGDQAGGTPHSRFGRSETGKKKKRKKEKTALCAPAAGVTPGFLFWFFLFYFVLFRLISGSCLLISFLFCFFFSGYFSGYSPTLGGSSPKPRPAPSQRVHRLVCAFCN
jgi:hypothetical protein